MIIAATVVLWMAALSRVVPSIRRPDPARISLTIALVFVSAGVTLHPGVLGGSFDQTFHWPYGSELMQHLFWAVGVYFTLRFLMLLRRGRITRRSERIQLAALAGCLIAMLALFWYIPVDPQTPTPVPTPFVVEFADNGFALGYRAVFELYLIYCLVALTALSLRNLARGGTDPASTSTSISLAFIGAATAVGALAAAAGLTGLATHWLTGTDTAWLVAFNAVSVTLATALLGVGLLLPIPVERFMRWRQATRTCNHFDGLWSILSRAVPDVVMPVAASAATPVVRAELRVVRRRLEIADALHRIRFAPSAAAVIRTSPNPARALGAALQDTAQWYPARGTSGPIAADLLSGAEQTGDDQIWALAAAYRSG
jgi:hypothetical protein